MYAIIRFVRGILGIMFSAFTVSAVAGGLYGIYAGFTHPSDRTLSTSMKLADEETSTIARLDRLIVGKIYNNSNTPNQDHGIVGALVTIPQILIYWPALAGAGVGGFIGGGIGDICARILLQHGDTGATTKLNLAPERFHFAAIRPVPASPVHPAITRRPNRIPHPGLI